MDRNKSGSSVFFPTCSITFRIQYEFPRAGIPKDQVGLPPTLTTPACAHIPARLQRQPCSSAALACRRQMRLNHLRFPLLQESFPIYICAINDSQHKPLPRSGKFLSNRALQAALDISTAGHLFPAALNLDSNSEFDYRANLKI